MGRQGQAATRSPPAALPPHQNRRRGYARRCEEMPPRITIQQHKGTLSCANKWTKNSTWASRSHLLRRDHPAATSSCQAVDVTRAHLQPGRQRPGQTGKAREVVRRVELMSSPAAPPNAIFEHTFPNVRGEGVRTWHRYQRSRPAPPPGVVVPFRGGGLVGDGDPRRPLPGMGARVASLLRSESNGAGMPGRCCRVWRGPIVVARPCRLRRFCGTR